MCHPFEPFAISLGIVWLLSRLSIGFHDEPVLPTRSPMCFGGWFVFDHSFRFCASVLARIEGNRCCHRCRLRRRAVPEHAATGASARLSG